MPRVAFSFPDPRAIFRFCFFVVVRSTALRRPRCVNVGCMCDHTRMPFRCHLSLIGRPSALKEGHGYWFISQSPFDVRLQVRDNSRRQSGPAVLQ